MPRIRTVKPALFQHSTLFDAEHETGLPLRLAYIGLFTCCDREGRFKWDERELKLHILPWDDLDFSRVLDALVTRGFVVEYASDTGEKYGWIPTFCKHQVINNRETASELPAPPEPLIQQRSATRDSRVPRACPTRAKRKGRERKGKEVNLKTKGTAQVSGTASRARAKQPPAPPTPSGPATITLAMRKAHISGAQPSNPRIIALAEQGVTPEAVNDACEEAHRVHPDESIPVAYVCTILERWQREPQRSNGHGRAYGHASSGFDERAKDRKRAGDELTGRARRAREVDAGDVIDVTATEIGHDPRHS
ncbi:hypothetical protein Bphy_3412 [Paraburkholderia phymatum STM815]|uniref:DnaT DNA-binding domain-containing protein n=1 Tax=Paraburkholderia phymatum (strain DSM 17167 / CIP 108236 / LMG 21445 / STM815) TaxID=391038 RepID=B2JL37_PARP8|nr:hypothetical protein Bphy_3412 [Paraburkholderia phymatum STM815]